MMIVLSRNIRGVMNVAQRRVVKKLMKKFHPDIFIILKPHCLFVKVEKFWDKLGFSPMAIIEVNGHSRGIWALGSKGGVAFSSVDVFHQAVSI